MGREGGGRASATLVIGVKVRQMGDATLSAFEEVGGW